jgi:hypothetical protein
LAAKKTADVKVEKASKVKLAPKKASQLKAAVKVKALKIILKSVNAKVQKAKEVKQVAEK